MDKKALQWILVAVIVLGSGYLAYSLVVPATDTPSEPELAESDVDSEDSSDEDRVTTSRIAAEDFPGIPVTYEEFGLKHELPFGWEITKEESEFWQGFGRSVKYRVADNGSEYDAGGNDSELQIVFSARTFQGDYIGPCTPVISDAPLKDILYSRPLLGDQYYLLGFIDSTSDPQRYGYIRTNLVVVNADYSHWYPGSLERTVDISDVDGIAASELEVGKSYYQCTGPPLYTPTVSGDGVINAWSISITSIYSAGSDDDFSILWYIVNNSADLQETVSLLETLETVE